MLKWQVIETRGIAPTARQGHKSIIIENNMFIFGGSSNADENNPQACQDPIAILNLDLHEWLPVGELGGRNPQNMNFVHSIIPKDQESVKVYWRDNHENLELSIFNIKERAWKDKGLEKAQEDNENGTHISVFNQVDKVVEIQKETKN
mmetsp:Transcript_23000/g.20434  ORF Transcript_23000/g.20434 Transcript_23000/m.20434 type:complete len:148 (+) Transcript_23000:577-1020(+)